MRTIPQIGTEYAGYRIDGLLGRTGMSVGRSGCSTTTARTTSGLLASVDAANKTPDVNGRFPPSSCQSQPTNQAVVAGKLSCTSPTPGVDRVVITQFPRPPALYGEYQQTLAAQGITPNDPGTDNLRYCLKDTFGGEEKAWSHLKPRQRAVDFATQAADQLPATSTVEGRVACWHSGASKYFIAWTDDRGELLGVVSGSNHDELWTWWYDVHHNLASSMHDHATM